MIKLKGLIKEFTEYNFDPMDMYSSNTKNAKAVERTLNQMYTKGGGLQKWKNIVN